MNSTDGRPPVLVSASDDSPGDDDRTADATCGMNPTFATTVGILLLVIIAALTGLTLRYRHRALAAEREVEQLTTELERRNVPIEELLNLQPGQRLEVHGPADAPKSP